jgi:hypothetical protein
MLKLIIKKTSYCLVLLLFYTISFIAQAAIQNNPPYPDVWGYDMSEFPAVKWGLADVIPYAMDDGDIWFVVTYSYKKTNPTDSLAPFTDYKYVLIKFFKGEQTILNSKERDKLFKIIDQQKLFPKHPRYKDITFSDGSKMKVHRYASAKRRCYVPDYAVNYFAKTDTQGKEKKYSILGAATQVSIWESDLDCIAAGGSPFLYQKLHTLTEIIPLKDDTFIVFATSGSNLILRFDNDFKTKFKPVTPVTIHGSDIMRNFFVIDYTLIEKFESQSLNQAGSTYQYIHDALLTYFQEQYPHK